MADLGLSDGTLKADLANLQFEGLLTDPSGLSTGAQLTLRVYGSLFDPTEQTLPECQTCATPQSVKVGISGLHYDNLSPALALHNVLFAFNIVGPALTNTAWPEPTPAGSSQSVQLGALNYQLTDAQIDFIYDRLIGYGYSVNNVKLGLGLSVFGDASQIQAEFETTTVPEPATLLLFATGAAPMILRRRNRH